MTKRYNSLAIYRIIAALAIIQFHIFFITYERDIPFEMLLSKGVQGLTALSGFLYAGKRIDNGAKFVIGATKKLLIPALVCLALMAIWNLGYFFSTGCSVNYFSLFIDSRAYNDAFLIQPGNYYYIIYIFVCYAITPLLKNKRYRRGIIIAAVLGELILSFAFGISIIVIPYLVGYILGEFSFEKYTDTKYRIKPLLLWLAIFAAAFALYSAVVLNTFGNAWILAKLHKLLLNLTSSAVGTASFFLFISLFKGLNRFGEPKLLLYTDRLGLVIFLMNQAFMCGGMDVCAYFDSIALDTALVYLFTLGSAALIDALLSLPAKMKEGKRAPQ